MKNKIFETHQSLWPPLLYHSFHALCESTRSSPKLLKIHWPQNRFSLCKQRYHRGRLICCAKLSQSIFHIHQNFEAKNIFYMIRNLDYQQKLNQKWRTISSCNAKTVPDKKVLRRTSWRATSANLTMTWLDEIEELALQIHDWTDGGKRGPHFKCHVSNHITRSHQIPVKQSNEARPVAVQNRIRKDLIGNLDECCAALKQHGIRWDWIRAKTERREDCCCQSHQGGEIENDKKRAKKKEENLRVRKIREGEAQKEKKIKEKKEGKIAANTNRKSSSKIPAEWWKGNNYRLCAWKRRRKKKLTELFFTFFILNKLFNSLHVFY